LVNSTITRQPVKLQWLAKVLRMAFPVLAGLWLIAMIVDYPAGNVLAALYYIASFLLCLLLATILTRTIPLRSLLSSFFFGASLFCVAAAIGHALSALGINNSNPLRSIIMPVVQESFVMLPVLAVLWIGRQTTTRLMGISDIMLMSAFSGAGFGVVWDALCIKEYGGSHFLTLTTYSALGGIQTQAGFGIWGGIAGLTLGVALFFWFSKPWTRIVAPLGFALASLDQAIAHYGALNLFGRNGTAFAGMLNGLNQKGLLLPELFAVAVVIAVVFESGIVGSFSLLSMPGSLAIGAWMKIWQDPKETIAAWDMALWTRRLAYLDFRGNRIGGAFKANVANTKQLVVRRIQHLSGAN